jgi:hypothetical protein
MLLDQFGASDAEQQDRCAARPLGDVLHHLEQGGLRPVEVVEDQHHQPLAGEGFEQPAHRPGGVPDRARGVLQTNELRDPLGDGPGVRLPVQQRAQLRPRRGRPVALDHTGGPADRLGQRPEGNALPVGQAAAGEDASRALEVGEHVGDQA